jgi:hydrogenase small subunit
MSPFYRRLPGVPGFGVETTATKIGLGLVGATAAVFAAHGVAKGIQFSKDAPKAEG